MHTVEQILICTFQLVVATPLDALEYTVGMISQHNKPNWHLKKKEIKQTTTPFLGQIDLIIIHIELSVSGDFLHVFHLESTVKWASDYCVDSLNITWILEF